MPANVHGGSGAVRRRLLVSSALIGGVLLPGAALGQVVPLPVPVVVNNGGATVTPSLPTAETSSLDVNILGRNRIITWGQFNVAEGASVAFRDSTNVATAANKLTVINRVLASSLGLNASTINGAITAPNINIWLVNPDGITVGAMGSFAGGGLVLTTLPDRLSSSEEAAFTAAGGALPASLRFRAGALAAPQAITLAGGAAGDGTITATGSIVAIAPAIDTTKTLGAGTSGAGSVALVAATDVTFRQGIDNPLAIMINAGTVLGTAGGTALTAGGSISGGSVVIAGGARAAIDGVLLGVTTTDLTATAANGAVVIATTATSAGGGAIAITNGGAATTDIDLAGNLAATGTAGDVVVNGAGAVNLTGGTAQATRDVVLRGATVDMTGGELSAGRDTRVGGGLVAGAGTTLRATRDTLVEATGVISLADGRTQATRDVVLNAGGRLVAGGDVAAGRNYAATGTAPDESAPAVTLGREGATVSQAAGGLVTVTAVDGDLAGIGTLTVQSNSAAPGSEELTLSAADGAITFSNTAQLIGGRSGARSDVLIQAAGDVTLGAVTGRRLQTLGEGDTVLAVAGNFAATSIDVTRALSIRADEALGVAGPITVRDVGAGVDLRAGSVGVGGLTASNGGDIFVSAAGNLSLAGAATTLAAAPPTGGTIALLANGTLTTTAASRAGEDVAIRGAGAVQLAAITARDDIDVVAGAALTLARLETTGNGADDRAVLFSPTDAGLGGISAASPEEAALAGSNIRIVAASIASGPALTGSTGAGLVIEQLDAGNAQLLATREDLAGTSGDIRIRGAATTGDLSLIAPDGSVSGLANGWQDAAGGSELVTTGNVSITAPGAVSVGLIQAGGTVYANEALGRVRLRRVEAAALDLTARGGLQIGSADIAGTARLVDIGSTAGIFSQTAMPLVSGYGRAGLQATGVLGVNALAGAAQLGATAGSSIDIQADAVDAASATAAATGSLFVLAESGRLTLGSGSAGTTATLWKRDDDAVGGAADILSVTGSVANGGSVEIRSVTDASVAGAIATQGNVVVQAARDASLGSGNAAAGSLALLAGRDAASGTELRAAIDVAVHAGRTASLTDLQAGDDIDLQATGTLSLARATTLGAVADTSAIAFSPANAGLGDPRDAGTGGVTFGGAEDPALVGSNIRLRAAAVSGPGLIGSTDAGLVVEGLIGGGATSLLADLADIRIGSVATTSGRLDVTAGTGSVTGLRTGWVGAGAGSSLAAPGQVIIDVPGSVTIGTIAAGGAVTGLGMAAARFGAIKAAQLSLSADTRLQIGIADVAGTTDLRLTGGTAGTVDLTGAALVAGYGRAGLEARDTSDGAGLGVSATQGVALLGTVSGSDVAIQADAIDATSATASVGSLFMLAEAGRLTLGTGAARTIATLWKRDDDGIAGTPAAVTDALFVTNAVTGGTGVTVRSVSDATVASAKATAGDLVVEATRDVALGNGAALAGTLALLGGRDAASATRLFAREDVSVDAGRDATFDEIEAGDDIDLRATGTLFLRRAATLGGGDDTRFVSFAPALAGLGDPRVAGTGGVTIGAPEDATLTGSTIRLRAATIGGPALTGSTDAGLVIERLSSGDAASIIAGSGDIRIGSATTSGGTLDVLAAGGSVSGLLDGFEAAGGGAVLSSRGRVIIDAPGAVSIGAIIADGSVTGSGIGTGRFGSIDAASLDLSAGAGLQIGSATVAGVTTLRTTGGTAAAFDLVGTPLAAGYGAADLDARGLLTVRALNGVAQLGTIAGSAIDGRAGAIDVVEATARADTLLLRADAGRLTLDIGRAATIAQLAKRDDAGLGAEMAGNALFVTTRVTGGAGVDARSATDATVARGTATTGDLIIQSARDASLAMGVASTGSVALLAGRDAISTTQLSAAEDVSVLALGDVTLRSIGAGDDIDLRAGGTAFLRDATTDGSGADGRAVRFVPAQAGLGDPLTTGSGGVTINAGEDAALVGSTIRIRAASVAGPALTGATDTGLVIERLASGTAAIDAAAGDIRIGSATTAGGLVVAAAAGSISGLRDGWLSAGGGSTLTTPGRVIIEANGSVAIGTIAAGDAVTGSGITAGRFGAIGGASLDLIAGADLQIGVATIGGATTLRTTGGTAAAIELVATPLVTGYGAADLDAGGLLMTSALNGAAQFGTIAGTSIDVRADAVDIGDATAREASLFLLAEAGRLTLGTGRAATTATVAKRDDAGIGPDTAGNSLFVTSALTGGAGVDVRSATDVTIAAAFATGGDLAVQAARDVSLATGLAATGTVAVLAGRDVASAMRLQGGEDASVRAGRNAALAMLEAGDDIDILAAGDLFLVDVATLGTGSDARSVSFTPAQAGLGNPLVAGTGGIAIGAPEDTALAGTTIRIRAASIATPPLTGTSDAGLVIEQLTSGSAALAATLSDIRLGTVTARSGDLVVEAGAGSVSGLAEGWTPTAGGATLRTPGRVIIGASLAATFGNIVAGGAVVSDGTLGRARFGRIAAGSLSLTAANGLQLGTADVAGATALRVTGGSAGTADLTATPLVPGYGAALLDAAGALTVRARAGAAQLDTIAGASVDIAAGAIDIGAATARATTLSLLAQAGRLTLGTGLSGTTANLTKQGSAGVLAVTDNITAGTDIAATSATDATIAYLVASGGSGTVTTTGSAAVRDGIAGTNLAITAGGDAVSDIRLMAGGSIAVDAGAAASIAVATAATGNLSITARGGALDLGTGRAGTDATLIKLGTADGLAVTGSLETGNAAVLASSMSVLAERVSAGGDLTVTSGGDSVIRVGGAGGSATITAGGAVVSGQALTAGGELTIDAARGVDVANATASAGALAITARSGTLLLGTGLAGSNVSLTSAGTADAGLLVRDAVSGDGSVIIRSATRASVARAAALAGDLIVETGGEALLRSGSAGRDITITSGGDAVSDIDLTAGRNLAIDAGGSADSIRAVASGGSLGIVARTGALTLGTGAAGIDAALTSRAAAVAVTGSLTGAGNVTVSAARDASVAQATATTGSLRMDVGGDAIVQSAAAGSDLTVAAGRDATIRNAAAGGSLSVSAGGTLASDTRLAAGLDVAIVAQGAADVTDAEASSGSLLIETRGGPLTLGTGRAGTDAVLTAAGPLAVTGLVTGARNVTLAGATDATIARATAGTGTMRIDVVRNAQVQDVAAGASLLMSVGNDASVSNAVAGANLTVTVGNDASVTTAAAGANLVMAIGNDAEVNNATAGGSLSLTTSGALVSATSLSASADVAIFAQGSATLSTVASSGGSLAIETRGGSLALGTGSAARDAALRSAADAGVGSLTTTAGGISIVTAGEAAIATGTAGTDLAITAGGAIGSTVALSAGRNAVLTSGTDAAIASVQAIRGDLSLAIGRDAAVQTALSGGNMTLTTTGSLTSGTRLSAGAALAATAGTSATIANAAADGMLSITTRGGALSLGTATAGSSATLVSASDTTISGALTAATDATIRSTAGATIGAATATGGALLVEAAGDASVRTGSAGTDLAITARAVTATGSLVAGRDVSVTAAQGATIAAATARTGALALTTTNGGLTLGTGAAGTIATLTKRAATGGITIATALTAPGNVLLDSAGAIEVSGAVTAGGTITALNSGTGATTIGGASGAAGFALAEAEVNRLRATNVVIDSGARDVTVAKLAVESGTGATALRFLTTGNVAITGAVSGGGAGTLQIGGRLSATGGGIDPATLARRITADVANGSVSYANGIVDLRAQRVTFGSGAEFNTYVTLSNEEISRIVANAGSGLYVGNTTRATFLTARTLTVSYADFALFQNTAPGVSGGASLNSGAGNALDQAALMLYSTGDQRDNSFAIFGTINGFVGRAAGVLPNEVLNIADTNPRVLRITQSNSRVNGCVIGSPDRGCLVTDVPRTEFRLYDERQTALFTTADDASLYANPLIGRGNEGLIVDIADVPVGIDTIECPEDEPNCRTPRSPQ